MADILERGVGRFHPKCISCVVLSEDKRVASGKSLSYCYVSSNEAIPIGVQFSVKILQTSSSALGIGVTTKHPDSGPVPRGWDDMDISDQYWYIVIRSSDCAAWHNAQERLLQWALDDSAGNTVGCHVSGTGELHLHHNGRDVGVAWAGLPTDQPLWGFVVISHWMVEANYIIPKVSETPSRPSPPIGPVPTRAQPKEVEASSTVPLPPQPSPSPPVPKEGDGALCQEVTADNILINFREHFIQCVDANAIVYGLEYANIISDGDLTEIKRNPDTKQRNEILHRCLKRSCDEEALTEVCDMMIAVRGNRKMNSLGRDMKFKLEGK